ncbi:unnamed protein product [Arabidopsis lyrata]|nr:unnamed protein product [Arabidopsis lyrata]
MGMTDTEALEFAQKEHKHNAFLEELANTMANLCSKDLPNSPMAVRASCQLTVV